MRTLVAILFLASMASAELLEAGNFRNLAHGIGGKVYLKDEKTLVIKDFTYDGAGPDAFFGWAPPNPQVLWAPFCLIPLRENSTIMRTIELQFCLEDSIKKRSCK